MEVKVVIGANAGDEGKGLVSGCLARTAQQDNKKTLTVFYNGTIQRAHSFGDNLYHCVAAGIEFGSDTYYHPMFVIDPIALWLTQTKIYIDPKCRLILPCDVLANRTLEKSRGNKRHGSCGFGLFAAVTRSKKPGCCVTASEMLNFYMLNTHLRVLSKSYPTDYDEVYNLDNFMKAAAYIAKNCEIITFEELLTKNHYGTVIYEGGQGLLLDQANRDNFPHLTPSSVGMYNIYSDIAKLNCTPDIFYVSRTYMTRHGAGPMEAECDKADINPDIVDKVNQPNEWQGSLRFGLLDTNTLYQRIQKDMKNYNGQANVNLVFTQLNYTNEKLATVNGLVDIEKPDFCAHLYVSNDKRKMERKE